MVEWYEWPSNFSGGQNVSGIGSFFQYADYATGFKLGYFLLAGIFAISFLSLKSFSSSKAFASSSFITAVLSIFLMRMGIISPVVTIVIGAVAVLGILLARDEHEKGL